MYCAMVEKEFSSAGRIWLSQRLSKAERRTVETANSATICALVFKKRRRGCHEREEKRKYAFGAAKLAKYELL